MHHRGCVELGLVFVHSPGCVEPCFVQPRRRGMLTLSEYHFAQEVRETSDVQHQYLCGVYSFM